MIVSTFPLKTRRLRAAGETHMGGRPFNEDAMMLRHDLGLYVVADGAGGIKAGNVAANLATASVARFLEEAASQLDGLTEYDSLGLARAARQLSAAVHAANADIVEASKVTKKFRGMGATVVAAMFMVEHRALHLVHVGDCRGYRLRHGLLDRLTDDHNLINDILETKPEVAAIALTHLPSHVATRALGMSSELRVAVRSLEIAEGDRYLFCTDGLHGVVDRAQLVEVLGMDVPCEERGRRLVELALSAGTADNVAFIVVDCDDIELPRPSQDDVATMVSAVPRTLPNSADVPPARPKHKSIPEILVVAPGDDVDSSPEAYVVPLEAKTAEVQEEIEEVVSPSKQRPSQPRGKP